jgi:hypothetical protein
LEGDGSGAEWLKAPQKCPSLTAELGSRDGRGSCNLRSSMVHVGTVIPVRAVRWAVERGGSGALRRWLLWPEPVEWDTGTGTGTDFTAWSSGDWVHAKELGEATYDCSIL